MARVWELDIGVEEAEIRGWPDGPVIIARARQGHPVVPDEVWQFMVDALNAAERAKEHVAGCLRNCGQSPCIHSYVSADL